MIARVWLSCVAVCVLVFSALAEEPKKVNAGEPEGFLEVGVIGTVYINGTWVGFNQGRRYGISINKHLPNARDARAKLAVVLKEQKQLDQVVFDWFGRGPLKRLDIVIGTNIPVGVAQALISAYATESKIPVYVVLRTTDGAVEGTSLIHVGSLVSHGKDPITQEQLREVLKPGLTPEQFAKLLPKIDE
jgi:hypothetical protein